MKGISQEMFSAASPLSRWLQGGGKRADEEALSPSRAASEGDGFQRLLSQESARAARFERRVGELEELLRRKTAEAAHHAQQRDVIHAQALALGQNALKPLGLESTPELRLQKEVVNASAASSASAARAQARHAKPKPQCAVSRRQCIAHLLRGVLGSGTRMRA